MIRRNIVSPISAYSQEGHWIKRKHEFLLIRIVRSGQFETALSITPDPFMNPVLLAGFLPVGD
jgi:hypothetical protein